MKTTTTPRREERRDRLIIIYFTLLPSGLKDYNNTQLTITYLNLLNKG